MPEQPQGAPGQQDRAGESPQSLATWWLARGEDQLPATADWLSAAERGQAGALRYAKRRTDFLLGRWTLKLAVSKVLGWRAFCSRPVRLTPDQAYSGPTA
jgi:hypothetical protein